MAQSDPGPSQPLSHALVASALTSYLDTPVTGVRDLAGSVANQDFLINTGAGDMILKAGPPGEMRAEAWACERVRRAGVTVPEVVALELDRRVLPEPFLLVRRLPGAGLTEGRHDALTEAGRQLCAVHALTGDGYGFLARAPEFAEPHEAVAPAAVPRGPHDTWAGFGSEALKCLDGLVGHEVIDERLAARIRKALREYEDAVAYDGPGVLLHGDLKPPHVFADGGGFTGIIDWGDVAFGDPRYDLARFSICGPEPLAALLAGYGLAPDPDLEVTFAVYRVIWNTTALDYELRAGGDWFAVYRSRIESDLNSALQL